MIQVIVPGFKVFPFSMRESWRTCLKENRIPHDWIVHKENKVRETAKKIKKNSIILLLNDHHLHDLICHLNDSKSFGKNRDENLWMALATEKVVKSSFPDSEKKTKAAALLCHMVAHFDPSAAEIISSMQAKPYFCHQYVDSTTFRSLKTYKKKENKILWAGKLSVGDNRGVYDERKKLFEVIKSHPKIYWRESTKKNLKINEIVQEKDRFKGFINLPSNCPGFTSNFFEGLAMGSRVFQHEVAGPIPSGLVQNIHYAAYDASDPQSLCNSIEEFCKDPERFERVAQMGQQYCLENHTLKHRIIGIFDRLIEVANDHDISPSIKRELRTTEEKLKNTAFKAFRTNKIKTLNNKLLSPLKKPNSLFYYKPLIPNQDALDLLKSSSKGFAFGKIGTTELQALENFERIVKIGLSSLSWKKASERLFLESGVFPKTKRQFDEFIRTYQGSLAELDGITLWHEDPFLSAFEHEVVAKHCPKAIKLESTVFWPFSVLPLLCGMRWLVVSPFVRTMKKQLPNMQKIFKKFDWSSLTLGIQETCQFVRCPQFSYMEPSPFESWSEGLERLQDQVLQHEFDLAIIGAGAWSLPLVAAIKQAGRKAMHFGGATQLFFGIRGKRWDHYIYDHFNEYWVRPLPEDTPTGHMRKEGGCYW
jgi:hypothetical protein